MMRIFALWLMLLCGPAVAGPDVKILGAEFGLFDASNPKELVFEPATVVPQREGQRYGWVIELRTKKHSVAVREEYILATPASEAGPSGNLTEGLNIPLPKRHQVSQRQLVPRGGRIFGEWAVGPGEPPGQRHLQVIVEGELAGSFDYEVK